MEGNAGTTPDEPIEPGQVDTPPPAEPVAPPAAATAADQPAAEPNLQVAQAEYTRSQQTIAVMRDKLGLDRKATREQVLEAFEARIAAPAVEGEGEGDDRTEREKEADARAFAAEFRVQDAIYTPIYGEGFAQKVIDLANLTRTTNDPEQLVQAVASFIEEHRQAGATEPAAEPVADGAPAAPPADVGLPEGDQGPSARPVTAAGPRRESGTVGAVREIFAAVGGLGRAPKA